MNRKKKKIFLLLLIVFIVINIYDLVIIFLFKNQEILIYLLLFVAYIILTIPFLRKEYLFKKIFLYVNSSKKEKSNYKYYRDLIDNYPIGAIFECYGEKINKYDQLVVRLLKLILTKKIKFENNEITIINTENLYPSEEMFIKAYQGDTVFTKKNLISQLNEDNYNDSLTTDLLYKKKLSQDKTYVIGIIFMFFIHIWNILILYKFAFYIDVIMYFYIICGLNILIFFTCIKQKRILFRTDKGIDIKNKLDGLKKFIEDFSTLDKRSIKEITLWDDYMIYAIIFNKKGTLNNETYLIYKTAIEKIIK